MKGRRSEWRGNPGSRRSRRSRSPLIGRKQRNLSQKRSNRSSGRRSASKERPHDHPLRRPDYGKDPVQEHTLLPPQHTAHNRHGSLPPRDDGFRFQQNPVLPDQPSTNPTWRVPQAVNHREFYSQAKVSDALPSSALGNIDGHFRQQKPAYGQEGSSRLLYSEQPMGSTLLDSERLRNSGDVIGTGIRENEFRSLNDRPRVQHSGNIGMGIQDIEMHSYNGLHRDQYEDTNKKQVYSKDLSFPKMPPAQPRIFLSAPSSSILKEEFKELRHDGNPDGLAPGIRRYPNDPLEHYTYRDISQPDPLRRNLPDPFRRGVPDPLRRDLPDPLRRNLPDPLRRDLPDPLRRELPDPLKRDLPDSLRRDLPDPFRRDLPDSLRRDVPDPLRRDLPDPLRRDRPDPLRGDPPNLLRRDLPNPLSRDLPNPLRGDPPNPLRRDLPNPMRRDLPNPLMRDLPDDSRAYNCDDLHPRGLDDYQHRVQEELYTRPPSRRNFTSSAIVDFNEGWMEKADSTNRTSVERKFSGHRDSIYRDFTHDFSDVGAQPELRLQELRANSDSWRGGLRTKLSRDYETMPFEEGFTSESEYFPADYREEHRHRRPLLSDHDLDQHKLVVSTHNRLDELRDYDIERMDQRHYTIYGDVDESDSDVFGEHRHSYAPYESEEMWLAEGRAGPPPSNSMLSEKPRYRKFSRNISASDAFMTRGASSRHAKNDHNGNLKRRLKRGRSEFHDTSFSERRQDLLRSYKHGKEMHERLGVQGGGTHESGSHFRKDDPPEDSEEFRQQVHKAFLRYSKLLNESPHSHRIYQNPGNPSNLLCCVCGSSSKEFADIKNLVTHTYHSLKVGLKTEHLGFHKALCVLFGWNWRVPPDASMSYQSMPVNEAEAMREDLILWPPLVIIHDSSIAGNVSNGAKDVTVEEMKKILRDMGFGTGMTGACLGKPSNKAIFAVKFMPTFSGLQEAQRLHNHFASKKCGKQEFRSNGKSNRAEGDIQSEDSDATLYGYMALAEDLDKLSEDTKKRCLVKSRKDIQAIADAPLNTAD